MIRVSTVILLLLPCFLCAQNINTKTNKLNQVSPVQQEVDEWVNLVSMKTASVAFLLQDLETGVTIANHRAGKCMIPASVQKLFTTATALEVFGRDKRFYTKVAYTGSIQDSILHGDLIIVGGGDPALGSAHFSAYYYTPHFLTVFTNAIRKAGIRHIEGRMIADVSLYAKHTLPSTWAWEDMGNYWGANPTALSVYDNTYAIEFNSPNKVDEATSIIKTTPTELGLSIENNVSTSNSRRDNAYIYGAPYSDTRYIEGDIPKNKSGYIVKGAMPNPAMVFLKELERYLLKSGVDFKGSQELLFAKNNDKRIELLSYASPYLPQIVNVTNLKSVNLYAEHLLQQIGLAKNTVADIHKALEWETVFWRQKGMDVEGLQLYDGSGLSHYNTMTAEQMVFLLRYMGTKSTEKKIFVGSLPIAGKSGTMSYTGRGTACVGRIQAKTGSMNRVRSYSGYVTSTKGKRYAFFFCVNNYTVPTSEIKKAFVQIMLKAIAN